MVIYSKFYYCLQNEFKILDQDDLKLNLTISVLCIPSARPPKISSLVLCESQELVGPLKTDMKSFSSGQLTLMRPRSRTFQCQIYIKKVFL